MARTFLAISRLGPILTVLLAASVASAQEKTSHRRPVPPEVQDLLSKFRIASFTGSNQDSIQATAIDSNGNVYVAGTTYSAKFPVKNAEQPVFGDASILQTADLGRTWTRVGGPPGGALSLAVDPVAPQVMFASASKGIYKSADSGQTWQSVYTLAAGSSFPTGGASLAIDPGNHLHIAAIAGGILIRSLDDGATWTAGGALCGLAGECVGQLLADPTGSGTLLVQSFGSGSISRDWGLTFQNFGYGPGFTTAAFDPSHPGWIYAGFSVGVSGSLYLTTDYGATFTQKASPPSGIITIAVDPDQPSTLVAETLDNNLYESTNGAASWTVETSTSEYNFTPTAFLLVHHACSASGGLFGLGEIGFDSYRVSFSPDFGITWEVPQFSSATSITAGGNCTFYVTRELTSDAFVAKISPEGSILWATYLGGSEQDAAVALALDARGNAYVAGNTSSLDFPATVSHIGPRGENSAFLAKLSPDGALILSATLGGEATNATVALAVDASQNAYVAGITSSLQFPVTPGTLVTSMQQESYTGFLAKLSSSAALSYATYLGVSYTTPGAMLVDTNEEPIVAGLGSVPGLPPPPTSGGQAPIFVMKLNGSGSRVLKSAYLPATGLSVSGLAIDSQDNLLAFGQSQMGSLQATPGTYSSPQPAPCQENPLLPQAGDAYIMKLAAAHWQTLYTAVLKATCGIDPGTITLDGTGAPIVAMAASSGLSLHHPIVAGPACGTSSSAIAELSADGSTLQFASYLDNCGIPAITPTPGGSLYVGVSPLPAGNATEVLHLETANSGVSLDGVANAFSGDASAVVFGALYSLAISGFEPSAVNLGLNPAKNLPTELSGVEVRFDGALASILAAGPEQIIVAASPVLATVANNSASDATIFTSVQVVYNGASSNQLWMPVSPVLPGLLTVGFPNAPLSATTYPNATALNADGTQNDADHPAAAGSTITLYATGLGPTSPWFPPGSIAHSSSVSPVIPVHSSWENVVVLGESPPPSAVSSIPGSVSAMFQVQVPVPANIQFLNGTAVGNGVYRVAIGLLLNVSVYADNNQPVSNVVGVYVK